MFNGVTIAYFENPGGDKDGYLLQRAASGFIYLYHIAVFLTKVKDGWL